MIIAAPLQGQPAPPMHPIGITLCVMAAIFVIGIAFLILKSFLDRRPKIRSPSQWLAHHTSLLMYHDTRDAAFPKAARRFAELFVELVPDQGPADSVQGEIIRSVDRLASEDRRNGNLNWEHGYVGFAVFLRNHLLDPAMFDSQALASLSRDLALVELNGPDEQDAELVRVAFGQLIMASVTFCEICERRPTPIGMPKHQS